MESLIPIVILLVIGVPLTLALWLIMRVLQAENASKNSGGAFPTWKRKFSD